MIQAGELRVEVDDRGEQALGMIPSASGHNGLEFHAWFGRKPAGEPGTVVRGEELELADFGMRHYQRAAEMLGMAWEREPLPPYFWGTVAELRPLRVCLKPDPVTMQQIILDQEWDAVVETSASALRKLGMARMADRMLSIPLSSLEAS